MTQAAATLGDQVTNGFVDGTLTSLTTIHTNLTSTAKSAHSLAGSAHQVADSSSDLADGSGSLAAGAKSLASGADQTAAGADSVASGAGKLDDAEWKEIQRHPEIGARILEHAGLKDIAAWVRAHHERVDGRGYPKALAGEEIPLEARILAVADAYEAMVADRPYRAGIAPAEARAELVRCAGTQFDPAVVGAFVNALETIEGEQGAAPAVAEAA